MRSQCFLFAVEIRKQLAIPFVIALILLVGASQGLAQTWTTLPGAAMDVGANAKGDLWVIGTAPVMGGYGIYHWVNGNFQNVPGGAVRISVDGDGTAWVINNTGNIFHSDVNGQWTMQPGGATDIGVGGNGDVWVIGANRCGNDYSIYKAVFSPGTRNVASWQAEAGCAARIAVGPDGVPWCVNSSHAIFRWQTTANNWQQTPGLAVDVAVGADGVAYVVGTNPPGSGGTAVYQWQGSNWAQIGADGVNVAAGPPGTVYITQNDSKQYAIVTNARAHGTVAAGPNVNPNTGGTTRGGTLQVGRGPLIPGRLQVSGLAPKLDLGPQTPGQLVCPIVHQGEPPRLDKSCTNLLGDQDTRTYGPAVYLGPISTATCPDKFRDDGDYCAKPDSYGRGGGYISQQICEDNKGTNNCEQWGGWLWYPKCDANFHAFACCVCSPDCPSGMDDIGVSCRKKHIKDCHNYGRLGGYGPAFTDPRNNGECWVCPAFLHRSMNPVDAKSKDAVAAACVSGDDDGIVWQSAQFSEPGLAAFVNNPDIVALAFSNLNFVAAFMKNRANGDIEQWNQLWQKMLSTPNDSAELKALIYAAILTVAQKDTNDSTKASNSVDAFEQYIRTRRTYLANDALAMYAAYKELNAFKVWQQTGKIMLGGGPVMFGGAGGVIMSPTTALSGVVGTPPDDYVGDAYAAAVPDTAGAEFVKAVATLNQSQAVPGVVQVNNEANTAIGFDPRPYLGFGLSAAEYPTMILGNLESLKSLKLYEVAMAAKPVSGGMKSPAFHAAKVAFEAGEGLKGLGAADLGLSLAGQLLDAISAFMTVFSQLDADKQYAKLLSTADQPVSIADILKNGSDDDKSQLLLWWALATSAHKPGPTAWPYTGPAGQGQMTDAQVCAKYTDGCQWMKTYIGKVMANISSLGPQPPPAPVRDIQRLYTDYMNASASLLGHLRRVADGPSAKAEQSSIQTAWTSYMMTKTRLSGAGLGTTQQTAANSAAQQVSAEIARIKGISAANRVLADILNPNFKGAD